MGPAFEWRGLVHPVCAVGSASPAWFMCCLQVAAASLLLFNTAARGVALHCVLDARHCDAQVCFVLPACVPSRQCVYQYGSVGDWLLALCDVCWQGFSLALDMLAGPQVGRLTLFVHYMAAVLAGLL